MWQIIGQDEAISLFTEGIRKGSLSHAYLFTGLPHTGKMTLALELAKAVNCTAQDVPCGSCNSCERIESGKHVDVRIINLATSTEERDKPRAEIGIDVFRDDIIKQVSLPPFEGKYRVYIFEGAENFSPEAANCFLKTLEEPLGRVLFVLLTTDEKLLPATVVSRCQRIKLKPLPFPEIESVLKDRYGLAPEKAKLIAHLSHGAAGWAVAAAEDEMLLEEQAETVGKAISLTQAGYEERFSYAAALALQFAKRNGLTEEFLDSLLDFWHDLLLVKLGTLNIITNVNILPELTKSGGNFALEEIRNFIGDIRAAKRQLELNASPRLVLEVLMLNMPRMEKPATARG
jgi:DNA polymerase-3 subunit delta'